MQLTRIPKIAGAGLLALTLAACGGGGAAGKASSGELPLSLASSSDGSISSLSANPSSMGVSSSSISTSSTRISISSSSASVSSGIASPASSSSVASSSVVPDLQPDAFKFDAKTDVKAQAVSTSNPVVIAGINGASPVSIIGGEYAINNGAFTSSPATVSNNQSIRVRLTSAAASHATSLVRLNVGGIEGVYSVTTLTDSTPPTAQIMFPTAVSMTEGNSVLVRGTARDNVNNIAAVSVNGVAATSLDNFSSWQVKVPLAYGSNKLSVSVKDAANNTALDFASVNIKRETLLKMPLLVAVDAASNRALVVDKELHAIISVNLTTGARSLFSDNEVPNARNGLVDPTSIALDVAHNRALITDAALDAVIAVDLSSGERSLLSSNESSEANPLQDSYGIAIDIARNRALVTDALHDNIIAVDLASGLRTLVSDNNTPDTENRFLSPMDILLDAENNRALVLDPWLGAIISLDLASGSRKLLAGGDVASEAKKLFVPSGFVIDKLHKRILVIDGNSNILAVDISSGEITSFSDNTAPGGLVSPSGIALDAAHNRVLVVDFDLDAVIAVDLESGERTVLSSNNTPNANAAINFPQPAAIVFDPERGRALVLDSYLKAVIAVDSNTGQRTVFSSNTQQDSPTHMSLPMGITLDSRRNRALVIDAALDNVIAINLTDGVRTLLSASSNPSFVHWSTSIALDAGNNQALVTDSAFSVITAVNLTDGSRTTLTKDFGWTTGMVFDTAHNRVLLADSSAGTVRTLNPLTGAVGLLAQFGRRTTPNTSFRITIDSANDRALVVDREMESLIAVDLAKGTTKVLSDNTHPDAINSIAGSGAAYDATRDCALVVDGRNHAVMAVDLVTGARVYLSR